MPNENDDDDHDVMTAAPSFVSVSPGATETDLPANPTDHQDRPVNAKPTKPGPQTAATSSSSSSSSVSVSASASASATGTNPPPESPEEDKADEDQESSHFLPHYFPTFGVSKRTQVWIYGALAIIVLFCAGLGTYFFVQRRRRRRSEREDYEFEMLDDEDAALNGGAAGAGAGKRKARRAGELYDAFAGESDEEGLLSDEEDDEEYRDEGPVERGKEGRQR